MRGRALALAACVMASVTGVAVACPVGAKSQVDLYPTASELPENLLRVYLYFPRPMARSEGADRVSILDARGEPVPGVLLATNQELWSPDRSRLTLLLDPGRVKSGLAAHERLGRALVPGERYTLVVSGEALDATGCPLGAESRHSFSVVAADLETPDPAEWKLQAPTVGSREPVVVDLDSPHDHLSMAYRLRIVDSSERVVPGAIALGPDETQWIFTPRAPWEDETYALMIDERLEDLAGNRPGVLFDRPVTVAAQDWQARRAFTPRPAGD